MNTRTLETRFVARWCTGRDIEDYHSTKHQTYIEADTEARKQAATSFVPDWYEVEQEEWREDYYGPGVGGWEIVRQWIEGIEQR